MSKKLTPLDAFDEMRLLAEKDKKEEWRKIYENSYYFEEEN